MPTIGLIGLGKKGYALAKGLQKRKIKVLAFDLKDHNRLRAANDGIVTTSSLSGVVMHLPKRKYICLILENGEEAKEVVNRILSLLNEGDVVVDAGTTKYAERRQFYKLLKGKGIYFLKGKIDGDRIKITAGCKTIPHDSSASKSLSFLS